MMQCGHLLLHAGYLTYVSQRSSMSAVGKPSIPLDFPNHEVTQSVLSGH